MNLDRFGLLILAILIHSASVVAQAAPANLCEPLFSIDPRTQVNAGGSNRLDLHSLPRIDSNLFTQVTPLANRRTYLARVGAQAMFIKIPRGGTAQAGAHEIEMMVRLNSMGLSAKLLGVTEFSGQFAIVSEAVEGSNTQFAMMADDNVRITKSVQSEMRRQAELLHENGIWPLDLQFMVSVSGQVKIVDPELFQLEPSRAHVAQDYQNLINQILVNWEFEDKVD